MAISDKQKRRIFARDHGVCANCGLDCIRKAYNIGTVARKIRDEDRRNEFLDDTCHHLKVSRSELAGDLWTCDHIRPRTRGGSRADKNIQTLCVWCHRKKTHRENLEMRQWTRAKSKVEGKVKA